MIPYNHTGIVRKLSEYILRRNNEGYAWIQGPFGIGKSYVVRQAIKISHPQLKNQLIFQLNSSKLDDFVHYFIDEISIFLKNTRQTDIIDKISQSVEIPKNAIAQLRDKDISQQLKYIYNINNSLKCLFHITNQLLVFNNIKIPIAVKLYDFNLNLFNNLIKYLPNTNIIPILICDNMSNILYFYKNFFSQNSFVLNVQEPEQDFIRNYIISNITNFNEIIDAIMLIAGHNLSLINRISNYLRENLRIKLENKEQNKGNSHDFSDEFYPHDKSKQDKQSYELLESQKALIMSLPETLFKQDIEDFNDKISLFFSFPPIQKMKLEMSEIHFKVTIYETIRYITSKNVMQSYNNNYQKNPVIMGLINSNILFYYTLTGKFVMNTLIRRLLIDFINSQYHNLNGSEMIEYNLNYLLNFKIIQKEVDLSL